MHSKLQAIDDPAIWTGPEISRQQQWLYVLEPDEIAALKAMAAEVRPSLRGDADTLLTLPIDVFKFEAFAERLSMLYQELKSGVGLALIKGLPVGELELLDIATIYWAIGLHLGKATPNNPQGDMLGHITDLGKTQKDANSRGYQTREAMDYHCDQADIVGLMCLRTAASGGVSKVSSSIGMYNELLATRPDYAEALTQELYWSKMGEFGDGEDPYYRSPVFNFLNGKCCISFGPKHIEKGHDLAGVPALTQLQRDAIRTAENIADNQRFEMILEPGDMQFLNNYVVLHTRSAYKDHDDPDKKRLLWRLWLMNPDLRPRTGYTNNFIAGVGTGRQRSQIRLS